MNILLFGTMYLGSCDAALKAIAWNRVACQQGVDTLAVDSASPRQQWGVFEDGIRLHHRLPKVFSFPDNIGHNGQIGQRDGWGRAFCKGVEMAINGGYDWAVHMETDLVSRVDFSTVIDSLKKPFAAPWCPHVNALETGLMFMNVQRLKELDFVKRYDWETLVYPEHCEDRVTAIFGDECERLPLVGGRFEYNESGVTLPQIEALDYFTHIRPWAYEVYTTDPRGKLLPLRKYRAQHSQ